MSFFGKNIRKIRSIRKISQTEFAKIFDLSRASVGSYEEGRAEPKLELINNVAKYFSITIDELINKELTVNDLYHFDVGNEPVFKSPASRPDEIREIPHLQSSKLVGKNIKQLESTTSKISIPLSSNIQSALAISINRNNFKAIPNSFEDNTCLIINTGTTALNNQQFYLLETNNAIYISKLNILANNKIHITQVDSEIHIINTKDIEYCFPVVHFISNIPPESLDERLNKLEKQLQLLISKTL